MKQLLLLLMFAVSVTFAQETTITGKVSGAYFSGDQTDVLFGVNIIVQNTTTGTSTDQDGNFSLKVNSLPVTIEFSYIGYKKMVVEVNTNKFLDIVLIQDVYSSQDVLVVGSRFRPRTSIDSPLPIDNIQLKDLESTSQTSLDKMLHYTVPSFNSTQQTISDATAHFDPADLRGLGPSRTLVLINGKRANPSALVFINDTPGKGDVGVDMNSIPINAVKRVEVLRDGASAQYGSDAIAGVINVVLNDETEKTAISAYAGATEQGDGFEIGATINTGLKLGDNGFLNVSTGYSKKEETNRAGSPGSDALFGVDGSNPWVAANPSLGMHVGLPNMKQANAYYNGELNFGAESKIYSYGGLVFREGLSYALYRTPYWVPDPHNIKHEEGTEYQGFQPTFETSIFDAQWTTGYQSKKFGWDYDLSYTFGKNSVDYKVDNSINTDMAELSPTLFDPGGYEFNNSIINFDISKIFFQKLVVSIGTEFRQENFIAVEGDEASYTGSGAQSFPGLQPVNAVDAKRTNVGVYLDLGYDITQNFFLGGAARLEDYSDFGENVSFKVNARVKTSDNRFSVRGAFSTGFRAPSLHQIHLSNIQTLISAGTVSNQGTFNNDSPVLRQLGVNKLKEETATNISLGIASRPIEGLFLSIDAFSIDLDDRIVYSSSISSSDTNTTVGRILQANSITSLKFFINAVNTNTKGIDIVATYNWSNWRLNFAASFMDHSIEGKINTPDILEQDGIDIFDRKEQSRILTARPTEKVILGAAYDLNSFTFGVTGIYFGSTTWMHVDNGLNGADLGNGPLPTEDEAFDQVFGSKVLVDLYGTWRITSEIAFTLSVNNLLNVYPDKIDTKGDFVTDLGGRFQYPWEVNQFGFNGRVILGSVNFNF